MAISTSNLVLAPYGAGSREIVLPVDGGSHIYAGTMVSQLTATGMLVAGSTAASGPCVGVADHEQDNSSGSDGALRCRVLTDRIFVFANGTSGDACSEATLLGSVVFMGDDHTVYDNSNSGTLRPAGLFAGMEPDGRVRVFVSFAHPGTLAASEGLNPGTSIQVAGGTFASGTATISSGIRVTASTDAFVVMSAVVTGSTNVGCFAHLKASNVAGAPGTGAVTLNILGDDGAVDADAAGAFRVLLIN